MCICTQPVYKASPTNCFELNSAAVRVQYWLLNYYLSAVRLLCALFVTTTPDQHSTAELILIMKRATIFAALVAMIALTCAMASPHPSGKLNPTSRVLITRTLGEKNCRAMFRSWGGHRRLLLFCRKNKCSTTGDVRMGCFNGSNFCSYEIDKGRRGAVTKHGDGGWINWCYSPKGCRRQGQSVVCD